MNLKNFVSILFVFFIFTGCQTIKEKSDSIAEKENKEYGKLVGQNINDLKTELGKPTEDYIDEVGNKVFLYKSKQCYWEFYIKWMYINKRPFWSNLAKFS